jgi:hypothetical protein
MNKYKFFLIILSFLVFVSSCQSLKEGITGTKRAKTSDEFFVEKKRPLVLPPDFEDMPLPKIKSNIQKDDTSIKDLLNLNKDIDQPTKTENDKSLEKSILNKIKTN